MRVRNRVESVAKLGPFTPFDTPRSWPTPAFNRFSDLIPRHARRAFRKRTGVHVADGQPGRAGDHDSRSDDEESKVATLSVVNTLTHGILATGHHQLCPTSYLATSSSETCTAASTNCVSSSTVPSIATTTSCSLPMSS